MKHLCCFLTLWVILTVQCCQASDDPTLVQIGQGLIRAIRETSVSGKSFYSFRSIPYAKPPLGELRFKDPLPAEPWEDVLDGSAEPEFCLQVAFLNWMQETDDMTDFIEGREDCLYLNVFTPQPRSLKAKLPVMVYIHGGAFISGGAKEYDPYVLLNEDVVLVILQYRLGIFGFLSTEDSVLPGNMGMKDQQLALKWVQENIANFGGDPDKVTIFGESAGGASVHMHILSPTSEGLFKRAIMQSGVALDPWATSESHKSFAESAGEAFECSLENGSETYLKCMQSIDSKFLLLFAFKSLEWGFAPAVTIPRVDGDFLPERPEILLKEGRYNKVNIMAGQTRNEGALIIIQMCTVPYLKESLRDDFQKNGPYSMFLNDESDPESLARELYQFYLKKKILKFTPANDEQLEKLIEDRYMGVGQDITSLFHASDEDISLYLYQFDHVGERSFAEAFPSHCRRNKKILHLDDLFYLFSGGLLFQKPLEKKEDLKMREIMVSLWTDFAKYGNPVSSSPNIVWEKATSRNFKYLSLTLEPKMTRFNRTHIWDFWLSRNLKQMKNIVGDERLRLPTEIVNDEKTENKEEL